MTAKIVCRLLAEDGRMLGWVEHHARVPGDGTLQANGDVVVPIGSSGLPHTLSMHWTDVNVETRVTVQYNATFVDKGDRVCVFASGEPMVTLGKPPVGLPMITVGSVRVGIPTGQLSAIGLQ